MFRGSNGFHPTSSKERVGIEEMIGDDEEVHEQLLSDLQETAVSIQR